MMNSMLGALVGDAAGATLEFYYREITEEIVINAMKMPGKGMLKVGPGQITDDGELILTLWKSLIYSDKNKILPLLSIIKGYSDWYKSCPFDIGRTCSFAFETYYDFFNGNNVFTLEGCNDIIMNLNGLSEANGALMRATAIATWVAINPSLDINVGIDYAKLDARLSHPNIVCQETNAIYVFTIINLLRGITPEQVIPIIDNFVLHNITSEKVKSWYFNESIDITNMNAKNQIGHVRWGFVLAFYFLRNPDISFEDAIKITLLKGGDTDTNSAIVGGMVGAYHKIPEYMLKPVLEFDSQLEMKITHLRPSEYCIKHALKEELNYIYNRHD